MPVVICACCKKKFTARQADINRGWGKFCSKSCKARNQTSKYGYSSKIKTRKARSYEEEYNNSYGDEDQSWYAHKY